MAAFVNSCPRPHLKTPHDWPDLRLKPVDYPFGPYADTFSEQQHKFGATHPQPAQGKYSPCFFTQYSRWRLASPHGVI